MRWPGQGERLSRLPSTRLRPDGAFKGPEMRVRYLEPEEIRPLLDSASNHLRPILITALHTGMRRGEILSLRWDEIDFRTELIYVRESKNGEGRFIPISAELRRTLQSLPSRFRRLRLPKLTPEAKRTEAEAKGQHPYTDLKNSFSTAFPDVSTV